MVKHLKKAWRVVTFVIPAAVVVVLAAAIVLYLTGLLPYKVYVIHTGSMSPTIPSKSAVVVREGQYRVGQVVAYKEHGEVVTHRLMAISPSGLITTKGDANRSVDPWHAPTSQVIGSVVAAPRMMGYWIVYAKNPIGLASLLLILFCFGQIWALYRELGQPPPTEHEA